MASDAPTPPNRYTTVVDLTSRAQAKKREEDAKSSFTEPDPPLRPADLSTLPDDVRRSVEAAGWTSLMAVQQKAIPYLLEGRDMIVQSQTGSGKTGAFLLPLFDLLSDDSPGSSALIMTPTRELAKQIYSEFERIRGGSGLRATVIYGGVRYEPQIRDLKAGVQVVIGTPGRILDHIQRRNLKLGDLRMLILDEADEMLSMGFYPDMLELRRYLPNDRQSAMFSATMPPRVRHLADEFLRDPGFLSLSTGNVGVDEISHFVYKVPKMEKDRVLVRLIEMENPESAIIFANTRREVEYLGKFLNNYGFDADSISGDLSQKAREKVMKKIRDGRLRFLVATDVAARGIDIADLSHVINYDVPQDPEYYVHRTGRTARAGKTGTAIALTTIEDNRNLLAIGQRYGINMNQREAPEEKDVEKRISERLTVTLESSMRDLSNLEKERLQRFLPLVQELSREEPELLALLLDELYQETLHKNPDGAASSESDDESDE
ncbi:MAG: DEAD/DEAH box helicase [Rhodothermales bacterium]|nr:DEAD/DEAH box helicase [Rhodothermales bacterium]